MAIKVGHLVTNPERIHMFECGLAKGNFLLLKLWLSQGLFDSDLQNKPGKMKCFGLRFLPTNVGN